MKRLLLVLLSMASATVVAAEEKKASPVTAQTPAAVSLTTAEGVRFAVWPKLPEKPSPILFVLANGQEETLNSKSFRQAGNYLHKDGVVCVSVDLPCHGADAKPDEKGLTGWRTRCDRGEDFMAEVTGRLRKVLDHLIEKGLADPERIAASGTSRGGFTAVQFAIADTRVKHVLAFAPLADLAMLKEFAGAEQSPLVKKLALETRASALAGRNVWVVIGDRDDRVSTDSVIRFARAAARPAQTGGEAATVDLHVIAEPRGHSVPAGYAELGAAWLRTRLDLTSP